MDGSTSLPESAYAFDQLGWLQFERLCSLVLDADGSLSDDVAWLGHADTARAAILPGPVTVVVVWVRRAVRASERVRALADRVAAVPAELGLWFEDRVVVFTNLDDAVALPELAGAPWVADKTVEVVGARALSERLDRRPELRTAMPSVLGLRDVRSLIAPGVQARSSFDIEQAQALARVFWPTRAYDRARDVLARHRFVVLTGPPEMGKTAIAQMIALAQLTAGWEAHECNHPDQVWRALDRKRPQVFVADDAFGSTEYRPDAAERWAEALGRLLAVLDEQHWLIWTSRPAPLKAGLQRVRRERGSERFPAPGEVVVDASDLDLGEKTLILFRHAKQNAAAGVAGTLIRSAALSIVEHPHFTPERIRRFVSDRLETLRLVVEDDGLHIRVAVERELAAPTQAMRTSFDALEDEHRDLLVALLDAPAGLIDERELAATVRRHHAAGLTRAPHELIDRLTDHFLRITPLGIGWVHPSWRDLVIETLRDESARRKRFLQSCGVHGAALALSSEGGAAGERSLPLLCDDGDWDALTDRVAALLRELEDRDLARLLLTMRAALGAKLEPARRREAGSMASYVVGALRRRWEKQARVLPVFLVEAWYEVTAGLPGPPQSPALGPTWAALHPGPLLLEAPALDELARADEWLALAQVLAAHDRDALTAFGFFASDQDVLAHLIDVLPTIVDEELSDAAQRMLARVEDLSPQRADRARRARLEAQTRAVEAQRWWVPEDIPAPPSSEREPSGSVEFTADDVDRVLSDL